MSTHYLNRNPTTGFNDHKIHLEHCRTFPTAGRIIDLGDYYERSLAALEVAQGYYDFVDFCKNCLR